jgi:hypothetical protein
VVTTPTWTDNYNVTMQDWETHYYIGEEDFTCESSSFEDLVQTTFPNGTLSLQYDTRLSGKYDEVTINCNNWRNPIVPGTYPGFYIRTYEALDGHDDIIDKSEDISLSATNLVSDVIEP